MVVVLIVHLLLMMGDGISRMIGSIGSISLFDGYEKNHDPLKIFSIHMTSLQRAMTFLAMILL